MKKVTWMARATTTIVGLAIMLTLVLGVATTALAGTGIGATFNLGKVNSVNAVSKLVGSVAGPSLQIDNNATDANATALELQVEPGKPPMKVNSSAEVENLNVDQMDGQSTSEFLEGCEAASVGGAVRSAVPPTRAKKDGRSGPGLPCALEVQDSSPASPKTWPQAVSFR
jgi:hypothetical protein